MSKYIQSFHDYSLVFGNIMLPKHHYNEMETSVGLKNIIELSDEQFEVLNQDVIFQDILKLKKYRVLETLPAEYRTSGDHINELNKKMSDKDKEINNLKARLSELENK